MATVTNIINEDGTQILSVDPEGATSVSLATANTYVDKNIQFIINVQPITNTQIDTIWDEED